MRRLQRPGTRKTVWWSVGYGELGVCPQAEDQQSTCAGPQPAVMDPLRTPEPASRARWWHADALPTAARGPEWSPRRLPIGPIGPIADTAEPLRMKMRPA